jgi:hypothetical protein
MLGMVAYTPLQFGLPCFASATAEELLKEYKACESPDYITYVIICFFSYCSGLQAYGNIYQGAPEGEQAS